MVHTEFNKIWPGGRNLAQLLLPLLLHDSMRYNGHSVPIYRVVLHRTSLRSLMVEYVQLRPGACELSRAN